MRRSEMSIRVHIETSTCGCRRNYSSRWINICFLSNDQMIWQEVHKLLVLRRTKTQEKRIRWMIAKIISCPPWSSNDIHRGLGRRTRICILWFRMISWWIFMEFVTYFNGVAMIFAIGAKRSIFSLGSINAFIILPSWSINNIDIDIDSKRHRVWHIIAFLNIQTSQFPLLFFLKNHWEHSIDWL